MSFDIFSAAGAETSLRITLEETSHKGLGIWRDVGREYERIVEDTLVHLVDIFVVEWWETGLELS